MTILKHPQPATPTEPHVALFWLAIFAVWIELKTWFALSEEIPRCGERLDVVGDGYVTLSCRK